MECSEMPEILFNGPAGRLEGRYTPAKSPNAPIAVLLSPHPLHGGTLFNKIVHLMNQAFMANGFATMRVNFRGVGKSQGRYDEGMGELADAAAALDWMQSMHKNHGPIWVGGFSFGAWISMQLLMRRPEISGFVSIAPPANLYDFSFLAPCPCGGLVIQGDKDGIVPEKSVAELVSKLRQQRGKLAIDYRVLPEANHFFKDQDDALLGHLTDYLRMTQEFKMAAE
jgi:alpha/beta superfamily hydrolase